MGWVVKKVKFPSEPHRPRNGLPKHGNSRLGENDTLSDEPVTFLDLHRTAHEPTILPHVAFVQLCFVHVRSTRRFRARNL